MNTCIVSHIKKVLPANGVWVSVAPTNDDRAGIHEAVDLVHAGWTDRGPTGPYRDIII